MRRKDREVTDVQQIVDIMKRCEVLHIALNNGEYPYVLPLNFGMEPDGMTLYVHGATEGQKYTVMQNDNRASFVMECTAGLEFDENAHECSMNYESVIGRGYLEEVLDEGEKHRALDCIIRHYRPEGFAYNPHTARVTRVLRLRVTERTAKRRKKMF